MKGKKKTKSVYEFIGLSKLHYKCNEFKKGQLKPINGLLKIFSVYTNFLTETLISLLCYYEKSFTLMNTWKAGKDLMKHHYQIKKVFTVNLI